MDGESGEPLYDLSGTLSSGWKLKAFVLSEQSWGRRLVSLTLSSHTSLAGFGSDRRGVALASVLALTSHWRGTAGAEHCPFQILQACEQMEASQERLRTTKADGTFTLGYSVKICVWAASFSL